MPHSQKELGQMFRNGATSGTASNVEIHDLGDGATALVGYGHAVYACRLSDGTVISYLGWANRDNTRPNAGSMSTKQQFSKLGLRGGVEKRGGEGIDAAPKIRGFSAPEL